MVGGVVIEVCCHPTDRNRLYVNCMDRQYKGQKTPDQSAIFVERNQLSDQIEIGDAIWWQSGWCYWTPQKNRVCSDEATKRGLRCGVDYDIRIPRIGHSGVAHPHFGRRER